MPIHRNYARYGAETVFYHNLTEFCAAPLCTDSEHTGMLSGVHAIGFGNQADHRMLEVLVENRNAATTVVVFHAAVDLSKTSLPVFIGRQFTEALDANLVFVSDPALQYGAGIGWYAGTKELVLQQDLVSAISVVQDSIPEAEHLVFFGASAGGFAALYYAHQFPGSLAVVANPQTNIEAYHPGPVQTYRDKCFSGAELSNSGIAFDINPIYAAEFPCHVIYLQNAQDDFHIEHHLKPWQEAVQNYPDRWRLHVDDWGPGHAPVPPAILTGILGFAAFVNGNWAEVFADEMFD